MREFMANVVAGRFMLLIYNYLRQSCCYTNTCASHGNWVACLNAKNELSFVNLDKNRHQIKRNDFASTKTG